MRIVEEDKFEEEIKDKNVIVQLSADWCGPCKVLTPVLESIAKERNINVFKVNIDCNPSIVQRYSVKSIPRIIFIKDGEVANDLTGNQKRSKLETICKEIYGV